MSFAALLGGCVDDSDAAGAAATKTSSEPVLPDMGALEGIVADDEQRPVVNADIKIRSQDGVVNRSSATRADGRFLFNGLAPGTYDVVVEALFFNRATQRVDVLAGETSSITFVLVDVVKSSLLVEVFPVKGFINCSIHSLGAYGPFNPCQGIAEDESRFELPLREDLPNRGVVLELVWSPGTPATGSDLELALCNEKDQVQDPINCRETTGSGYREGIRGRSPLVLRAQDLPLTDYPQMQIIVGDGGQTSARVPLTFQQSFELWISLCYVDYCSETYSARPPS